MNDKSKQHQLGQHYSSEESLIKQYDNILLECTDKVVVDPFCGEGHLIFYYLELFSLEQQIYLLKNKMVRGFDIYEHNINFIINKMHEKYNISKSLLQSIFTVRDSLLDNSLPENTFILTNPPYLAKNICQKKFKDDFETYFLNTHKEYNDYFEIALNLYSQTNGIWITPANLFSSEIMKRLRKKLIQHINYITIFKIKTFDDTGISVATFMIDHAINNYTKEITFIGQQKKVLTFHASDNGSMVSVWEGIRAVANTLKIKQGLLRENIEKGNELVTLLNEQYKPELFSISENEKHRLLNNILILRTADTGGANELGKIGLYTIDELWKNNDHAIGLVTKISSRIYVPLFFNNLSIDEQLKLKHDFNTTLNHFRDMYDSLFLTNYQNVSNGSQRKRISFKDVFSLINYLVLNSKPN